MGLIMGRRFLRLVGGAYCFVGGDDSGGLRTC